MLIESASAFTETPERAEALAMLAHELRGPLSTVLSFADLLATSSDTRQDAAGREWLEAVIRNTHYAVRLVDDLRLLAEWEANALPLQRETSSLAEVIRPVLADAMPAMSAAGVSLVSEITPGPSIRIDSHRVRQALANLIDNAIKFTPARGVVTVRAWPEQFGWSIEVKDTGAGIPADELARLFRPFARGRFPVHSGIPGSGLGLMVTHTVVTAHRGTIAVRSEEARGTTVSVFLPCPDRAARS